MRSIAIVILLSACVPEDEGGDTEATGTTMYRDAGTTSDGTMTRPPETPEPQPSGDPMRVTLDVAGTGTFDVDDGDCQDEANGAFKGLYESHADIDDDGVYVATMGESDATFQTPSGCSLPTLSIGALTGVTVRGELSNTSPNCDAYCGAKARAVAEADCEGDADEAGCRIQEEATYQASCGTACSGSTTRTIVAETTLGATALLGIDLLGGTALGTVEADLTFDHLEDESGNEVPEAP